MGANCLGCVPGLQEFRRSAGAGISQHLLWSGAVALGVRCCPSDALLVAGAVQVQLAEAAARRPRVDPRVIARGDFLKIKLDDITFGQVKLR